MKLYPTRKFSITVGARRIEFDPETKKPITAAQIQYLKNRHYVDGWVKEMDLKRDPHIIRRRNGRIELHDLFGTNCDLDLEYLCLKVAAEKLGVEGARAKKRGQNSYVKGLFRDVRKRFAGQFDEILVDGADDITAKFETRALLMAHDTNIATEALNFLRAIAK